MSSSLAVVFLLLLSSPQQGPPMPRVLLRLSPDGDRWIGQYDSHEDLARCLCDATDEWPREDAAGAATAAVPVSCCSTPDVQGCGYITRVQFLFEYINACIVHTAPPVHLVTLDLSDPCFRDLAVHARDRALTIWECAVMRRDARRGVAVDPRIADFVASLDLASQPDMCGRVAHVLRKGRPFADVVEEEEEEEDSEDDDEPRRQRQRRRREVWIQGTWEDTSWLDAFKQRTDDGAYEIRYVPTAALDRRSLSIADVARWIGAGDGYTSSLEKVAALMQTGRITLSQVKLS